MTKSLVWDHFEQTNEKMLLSGNYVSHIQNALK